MTGTWSERGDGWYENDVDPAESEPSWYEPPPDDEDGATTSVVVHVEHAENLTVNTEPITVHGDFHIGGRS